MRWIAVLLGLFALGCSSPVTPSATPNPQPSGPVGARARGALDSQAAQPTPTEAPKGADEVLKAHEQSARALSGGMKDVDTVLGRH